MDVKTLEERVCSQLNVPAALATSQARVAIHLAVKSIIRPGQEVVLSPYTISDVVNMVVCAGGVPVFADIDRETCNINVASMKSLLGPKTGAVLVTHLHGQMCDMPEIVDICRKRGVALIEDAAQAFGSHQDGRWAGTWGDAGIFSFGMYKNLCAIYGGMLVSNNPDIVARAAEIQEPFSPHAALAFLKKSISALITDIVTHPLLFRTLTFWIFRTALLKDIHWLNRFVLIELKNILRERFPKEYEYRMTPLQARLILEKLDDVLPDDRIRIEYARLYHEGLQDIPELILTPLRTDGSYGYTYYPIQFDQADGLVRHLMRENRDVARQHLKNCAALPCFKPYHRECPNAARTAAETIILPTYPRYGRDEVLRNVASIRRYFGRT